MKAQTRKGAAIETGVNLVVGFTLTWIANRVVMPWFGFVPPASALLTIGGVMTVVSIVRQFTLRRIFERLRIRKIPPAFLYIVEELAAERHRQISGEGYSLAHDDQHRAGDLADAAAAYCLAAADHFQGMLAIDPKIEGGRGSRIDAIRKAWRWTPAQFKPHDRRRCLIKAGALIIAEIGRSDREDLRRVIP